MAANFRLFSADHATIVDRLVKCVSHSLILYLFVVGVVLEELEPNYDRLEPEVDVWTASKRDIGACKTCTTRNYVNCCNYYGLCCHILERCPAISVIICSQRCNGGCLNGQWCCPTRTRYPCCTDPLQTTAANDGEQGGDVGTAPQPSAPSGGEQGGDTGSPPQPSTPDSNPATAPTASVTTTLASAEATSGATAAVTSVTSQTVITPASASPSLASSAATSATTEVSTVAITTTPPSVGTTMASAATATSAPTTTDEGEIENVPDTEIVLLPTRRPTVGVRVDGDDAPPPVVIVLSKSATSTTDASLEMDTQQEQQQHEKEYFQ